MKRIEETSIKEIIANIGLNINDKEFAIIFRGNEDAIRDYNEVINNANKYIRNYNQMKNPFAENDKLDIIVENEMMMAYATFYSRNVEELLIKYQDIIDKEAFVMLSLYNNKILLDGSKVNQETENIHIAYIKNAIELLEGVDRTLIFFEYIEESNIVKRINMIKSKDLVKYASFDKPVKNLVEPNPKKKARFKKAEENIGGLEIYTSLMDGKDLKLIMDVDSEIINCILKQIRDNILEAYYKDYGYNVFADESTILRDKIVVGKYLEKMTADALRENCKYIDIDKMLLIIGYRIIENIEYDRLIATYTDENNIVHEDKEVSIRAMEIAISNLVMEIQEGTEIDVIETDTKGKAKYTKAELEEALKRFKNGKYFNKRCIEEWKQDLINGKKHYSDIPLEMSGVIWIEGDEYTAIITKYEENMLFVIENKLIGKEELYTYIDMLDTISDKVLNAMINQEMMDIQKVMELFEQGKIGANQIGNSKIRQEIDTNGLILKIKELYKKISDNEQDKEETTENLKLFNNYANLYRVINIQGKSEEEIEEAGMELISFFESELTSELLQDLYQYGVITLDVAVDWGAKLNNMLEDSQIKPVDLKRLYAKGTITFEQIKNVIKYGNLSVDEKQDIIYSTFDGDTEDEIENREKLIQFLMIGDSYKEESENVTIRNKATKQNNKKDDRIEFVTDPQTRWKLISLLDDNYSKKFLPKGKEVLDGHRMFLFPSHNKIIIEKMYENTKKGIEIAYGNATYVMNANDFFDNVDEIIIKGAINRSYLRRISKDGKSIPIIHSTSWGKKVMEYFEVDMESGRYTEEEILEIEKAAERVVSSRRERE